MRQKRFRCDYPTVFSIDRDFEGFCSTDHCYTRQAKGPARGRTARGSSARFVGGLARWILFKVVTTDKQFDINVDKLPPEYGHGIGTATTPRIGFDFVLGGAAPGSSTWAMMLLGFSGLGYGVSSSERAAPAQLRSLAPTLPAWRPWRSLRGCSLSPPGWPSRTCPNAAYRQCRRCAWYPRAARGRRQPPWP